MRNYYGIEHAIAADTRSPADILCRYDSREARDRAIDETASLQSGAITRCTRDFAHRNFEIELHTFDSWDDYQNKYIRYKARRTPPKPRYYE